jgi:choline dehydrogenase-like flavoprotein
VRGKIVVLAAGALMTPAILLASKSPDWPHGLANDHDVVGRNFMRHLVDGYLFGIKSKAPVAGQIKELSFNDLYLVDGVKYGTVQSLGFIPSYDFVMNASRGARRWLGLLRWPGRALWERLRRRIVPIAAILEDLPYADNRVRLVDSPRGEGPRVQLEYRIRDNEKRRLQEFQRRLKQIFKPYRPIHGSASTVNSALGHACGTCRFGTDPKSSVFDAINRAHGVENLYCVDTSILPSSSGINPSLTIAANALRVADHLHDRL